MADSIKWIEEPPQRKQSTAGESSPESNATIIETTVFNLTAPQDNKEDQEIASISEYSGDVNVGMQFDPFIHIHRHSSDVAGSTVSEPIRDDDLESTSTVLTTATDNPKIYRESDRKNEELGILQQTNRLDSVSTSQGTIVENFEDDVSLRSIDVTKNNDFNLEFQEDWQNGKTVGVKVSDSKAEEPLVNGHQTPYEWPKTGEDQMQIEHFKSFPPQNPEHENAPQISFITMNNKEDDESNIKFKSYPPQNLDNENTPQISTIDKNEEKFGTLACEFKKKENENETNVKNFGTLTCELKKKEDMIESQVNGKNYQNECSSIDKSEDQVNGKSEEINKILSKPTERRVNFSENLVKRYPESPLVAKTFGDDASLLKNDVKVKKLEETPDKIEEKVEKVENNTNGVKIEERAEKVENADPSKETQENSIEAEELRPLRSSLSSVMHDYDRFEIEGPRSSERSEYAYLRESLTNEDKLQNLVDDVKTRKLSTIDEKSEALSESAELKPIESSTMNDNGPTQNDQNPSYNLNSSEINIEVTSQLQKSSEIESSNISHIKSDQKLPNEEKLETPDLSVETKPLNEKNLDNLGTNTEIVKSFETLDSPKNIEKDPSNEEKFDSSKSSNVFKIKNDQKPTDNLDNLEVNVELTSQIEKPSEIESPSISKIESDVARNSNDQKLNEPGSLNVSKVESEATKNSEKQAEPESPNVSKIESEVATNGEEQPEDKILEISDTNVEVTTEIYNKKESETESNIFKIERKDVIEDQKLLELESPNISKVEKDEKPLESRSDPESSKSTNDSSTPTESSKSTEEKQRESLVSLMFDKPKIDDTQWITPNQEFNSKNENKGEEGSKNEKVDDTQWITQNEKVNEDKIPESQLNFTSNESVQSSNLKNGGINVEHFESKSKEKIEKLDTQTTNQPSTSNKNNEDSDEKAKDELATTQNKNESSERKPREEDNDRDVNAELDAYGERLIQNTREALALVDKLCQESMERQERRKRHLSGGPSSGQPDENLTGQHYQSVNRPPIVEFDDLEVEVFRVNSELLEEPKSCVLLPDAKLLVLDTKLGLTLMDLQTKETKRCAPADDWRDVECACYMKKHNQILLIYEQKVDDNFHKYLARFDMDLKMLTKCEAPKYILEMVVVSCRVCYIDETDCIYLAVNTPNNAFIYELNAECRWTEVYNMRGKQISDIVKLAAVGPVTELLVVESTKRHIILLGIYNSSLAERALIAFCSEPAALCVDEQGNLIVFDRATNLVGVHSRLNFERIRDLVVVGRANCSLSAQSGYLALLNQQRKELRICKY